MQTQANELLLVEEVAREMRVPVATVRWWVRTGKLPASRPGRRLLVRRSDIERLLAPVAVRLPATPAQLSAVANGVLPVAPSELERRRAEQALKRLRLEP